MGIDWHVYVERKVNPNDPYLGAQWEPYWEPLVDRHWWFEYILHKKVKEGSIQLLLPGSKNPHADGVNLYRKVPIESVESEYGHHTLLRNWFEHHSPEKWSLLCHRAGVPFNTDEWTDNFRLADRDYDWFSMFINIDTKPASNVQPRNPPIAFAREFPEDASRKVLQDWQELALDGDYRDPGHIGVSNLIEQADYLADKFGHFKQIQWLRKHIVDPDSCRLIFWFN